MNLSQWHYKRIAWKPWIKDTFADLYSKKDLYQNYAQELKALEKSNGLVKWWNNYSFKKNFLEYVRLRETILPKSFSDAKVNWKEEVKDLSSEEAIEKINQILLVGADELFSKASLEEWGDYRDLKIELISFIQEAVWYVLEHYSTVEASKNFCDRYFPNLDFMIAKEESNTSNWMYHSFRILKEDSNRLEKYINTLRESLEPDQWQSYLNHNPALSLSVSVFEKQLQAAYDFFSSSMPLNSFRSEAFNYYKLIQKHLEHLVQYIPITESEETKIAQQLDQYKSQRRKSIFFIRPLEYYSGIIGFFTELKEILEKLWSAKEKILENKVVLQNSDIAQNILIEPEPEPEPEPEYGPKSEVENTDSLSISELEQLRKEKKQRYQEDLEQVKKTLKYRKKDLEKETEILSEKNEDLESKLKGLKFFHLGFAISRPKSADYLDTYNKFYAFLIQEDQKKSYSDTGKIENILDTNEVSQNSDYNPYYFDIFQKNSSQHAFMQNLEEQDRKCLDQMKDDIEKLEKEKLKLQNTNSLLKTKIAEEEKVIERVKQAQYLTVNAQKAYQEYRKNNPVIREPIRIEEIKEDSVEENKAIPKIDDIDDDEPPSSLSPSNH